MALCTVLTLVIYLWNMPHALDYPEYDEAAYFYRGYLLSLGNWRAADIINPNGSPVSVAFYAAWYLILRTPLLYPWVMASSLFVMGLAAYLLLSRILPPALSWVLALAAVVASAPFSPWNANYYLGTAILWLSLAQLDHRVWRRGLAVLGVLLATYARPEFAVVLVALLLALAVYEIQQYRRHRVSLRSLLISYAPVALGLLVSFFILSHLPAGAYARSSNAVPWSYNDYYNYQYHAQFHGADSYANPWVLFEKDFGPVQPRTITNTLAALTRNPSKAEAYLTFEAVRLCASFGTAALSSFSWRSDAWESRLQVTITAQDTWQLGLAILLLLTLAGVCYWWLGRTRHLDRAPAKLHMPALLGIASLAPLVVPLVLINPHQRFFMLFPLVLLVLGYCLVVIGTAMVLLLGSLLSTLRITFPPAARATCYVTIVFVLVMLAVPQPYLDTPIHPIARTLAFLRANVPPGSTIVGEPVISYEDYLAAEGIHLNAMSPAAYPGSGLVGAFEADPSLRYALLTRIYPQSTYDQWFSAWNATFPQLRWTLVAQEHDPALQLYALPPHSDSFRQVTYDLWMLQERQLGLNLAAWPAPDALDFDHAITWHSENPGHSTEPLIRPVGNVPALCFIMHPYYPGLDKYTDVSSQVEGNIPADWSERTLVFFAALAPWAASQPDAKGVKVVISAPQIGYSQSVEVLNDAQLHWNPILVRLPHYTGPLRLVITIQPRVSLSDDTTLISFVGVTKNAGSD